METDKIEALIMELLYQIENNKPNNRSEADRLYAILKTDTQKLYALYLFIKNELQN